MKTKTEKFGPGVLGVILALAVFAFYAPSLSFGFLSVDDAQYVRLNPAVADGLSLESLRSAFSGFYASYWIPLTWISLAADVSLFGLSPGAIHGANVFYFALACGLLYVFLARATGEKTLSLFAVCLFALHPMRVESVAWISGRKDVLSAVFFLGSLNLHLSWLKTGKSVFYGWAVALFAFALMAKPLLVTAPLLLLALDFWPLGRLGGNFSGLKKLVIEKIPYFLLAAVFAAVTALGQFEAGGRMKDWNPGTNLSFASLGYARALLNTLWPFGFRFSTYLTEAVPPPAIAAAAALLVGGLFFSAWRWRGRAPELFAGFFWFFAALFPVSGMFIVGMQPYADRFSFVPHILLVAGGVFFAGRIFDGKKLLAAVGIALAAIFGASSYANLGGWRDTPSFIARLKAKNPSDPFPYHIEGMELVNEERYGEALPSLKRAAELSPETGFIRNELGMTYVKLKMFEPAIYELLASVNLGNRDAGTHFALGMSYATLGDFRKGRGWVEKSIELEPKTPDFPLGFGIMLYENGMRSEAAEFFARALAAAGEGPDAPRVLDEIQRRTGQR